MSKKLKKLSGESLLTKYSAMQKLKLPEKEETLTKVTKM
jgi:hypothetical protein